MTCGTSSSDSALPGRSLRSWALPSLTSVVRGGKPFGRLFRAVVGAVLAVLLETGDAGAVVHCYIDPASSYDTERGFFVDPARKTALSLRPSPCAYTDDAECDNQCLFQHENGPIAKIDFDYAGTEGVCRDPVTGLDHALVHTTSGQYMTIQFWSVNPDSGEVKREYQEAWYEINYGPVEDRALLDADGRCLWRDRQQGHAVFQNVLSALRVGQDADPPFPEGAGRVLPVREISAETARQQLLALDAVQPRMVKFGAPVYADEAGRAAWRVIQMTGTVLYDARGVVLVEDRRTGTWRALYDIRAGSGGMESLHYPAQFMVVAGNTLTVKLPTSLSYHIWGCFEIDLPTSRAMSRAGSVCDEMQKRHYPDWGTRGPDDEKPFALRRELGMD